MRRAVASFVLALGLVIAPALAAPAAANTLPVNSPEVASPAVSVPAAANILPVYSPYAPAPVNFLPSTVGHVGNAVSPLAQARMGALVYANQPPRDYWGALATKNAGGTMTLRQSTVVDTVRTSSRLPVGGFKSLVKTAGGVGATLMVADAAILLGAGALDLAWSDRVGMVCRNVGDDPLGELVAYAASADCAGFDLAIAESFVPNAGLQAGVSLSWCVDGDPARCLTYKGGNPYNNTNYWCFDSTAASATFMPISIRAKGSNDLWSGSSAAATAPSGAGLACYQAGGERRWGVSQFTGTATEPKSPADWEFCPSSSFSAGVCGTTSAPMTPVVPSITEANPTRTMTCVILGTNGSTYRGQGVQYTETDEFLPTPRCPSLPAGVIPAESWLESSSPGLTTERLMQQLTAPAVTNAWNTYPECREFNCATELWSGTTNCHENPAACLNWFEDPNKASTYSCKYGSKVVDLAECTIYADGFRSTTGTSTPANPDSLSDPNTGAPLQAPYPTGRDAQLSNSPLQGGGSAQCFPTGFAAFNPVEWVMRPVQCALEWAFVPRSDVMTQLAFRAQLATDGTALAYPATVLPMIAAPFAQGGSGCSGPPWHIEAFGVNETFYPFSACEEPVAGAAAMVRLFLTITVVLLTVLACIRYLGGVLGFVEYGRAHVGDAKQTDTTNVGSTSSKSVVKA